MSTGKGGAFLWTSQARGSRGPWGLCPVPRWGSGWGLPHVPRVCPPRLCLAFPHLNSLCEFGLHPKTSVSFAKEINVYSKGMYVELDISTKRNLELVEAMRTKKKAGSLLGVLDKTKTAMGARLLRSWILRPLLNPAGISRRQASVGDFYKNIEAREDLSELLSSMLDIERLTAKVVYGTANAKDLKAICQSISAIPEIKSIISRLGSDAVKEIYKELDTLDDIRELLTDAIAENPPYSVREGGMIREGYDEDIDYYRSIKTSGKDIMRNIEEREREDTGIKTLKVDYNKVFGYYIEVSKSFTSWVSRRSLSAPASDRRC